MLAEAAAFVAEVDALLADVDALLADVLAAEAEAAALVAEVVADAASTSSVHLATSTLVVIGKAPLEVCAVITWKMLFVVVSFAMSRTKYTVLAAQLPRLVPSVSPRAGLPVASKPSVLLARRDASGNTMLMVVGSVCGADSARVKPSEFCWAKIVCWSSSSFRVLAKKSPPVVKSVDLAIVRLPTMAYWVGDAGANAKPVAVMVTEPVPLALITTV